MSKKMLVVAAICALLLIPFIIDIVLATCFSCPTCGGMGMQIGRYKMGYTWICTYQCLRGHVWQCACY